MGTPFDYTHTVIRKKYLDTENWIEVRVSKSGEILDIDQKGIILPEDADELNFFDSCYIDVPVPFKRGDLVELENNNSSWMGNIFVLQEICRYAHERLLYCGDLMDMTADLFYESAGSLECECIHFYPNLRYCRRELEGEARILRYVSLYMQGKLCLCGLLKLQKFLLTDEIASSLRNNHNLKYELDRLGDKLLSG